MTETASKIAQTVATRAREGAEIHALTKLLTDNLKTLETTADQHLVTAITTISMLACLPGAADLDPKYVGAVVRFFTKGQKDEAELRNKISVFIAEVITVARQIKAAEQANQKPEA